MELTKITGNTYYIPGPTNIGVYQFKDRYSLLIDTGSNNSEARKIGTILSVQNINIKYILNSHEHIDHCGGNIFLRENFPGSIFYGSRDASLFIENDYLFPLYIYGGNPLHTLSRDFVKSKKLKIDYIIETGTEKINNEKFDFIPLPGHARGQMGIATRDKVCFIGDALFSEEILNKYSAPFLMDIKAQFDTYDTIAALDYDYYVLGHALRVYPADELPALITLNRQVLDSYLNLCLELMDQPKTREEVLEEIIILEELSPDLNEYYFLSSTIAAMISYLFDNKLLKFQIENGRLFFYK